jgi:hypothetical protein
MAIVSPADRQNFDPDGYQDRQLDLSVELWLENRASTIEE